MPRTHECHQLRKRNGRYVVKVISRRFPDRARYVDGEFVKDGDTLHPVHNGFANRHIIIHLINNKS